MVKLLKKVKGLKLKITSIFLIMALLVLEFSPLAVKATAQQLQFYAPGIVAVGYDSYNGKNVWYSNATLGGQTAYCMDYTCAVPSGTMTFSRYLSDQGMAVLMNGYPNCSPESIGCASADEAYMATQMAIWEVLNRTGESHKSGLIFRVNNVTPKAGMQDFYNRAVSAAARLVAMAEANPYSAVPSMTIDNANVALHDLNGDAFIGPYSVTAGGGSGITTKSITASLVGAPASARVTDASGNPKNSFGNGEQIYVRMSTSEDDSTFAIRFRVDVDKKVGAIYEKPGEAVQDFVKIETEPAAKEHDLYIKWSKVTTIGKIVLVKSDQDNQPVHNAHFYLKNSKGEVVAETYTGTDGKSNFYNVPEGNYTLEEVEAPEGYVIKEKSKNITVKGGETTTVNFVNERITGKLVITKIDDANRPLKNVTFDIYDKDGYKINSVTTDENGKATVNVSYGTYYFKEVSAPAGYIMDDTLYRFNVTAENRTFYQTVTNERYKGNLLIVKTDDANTPIQGVKFKILDSNKNELLTITTNAKGLAGVKNMPLGTYYYQEVEAPDNVVIDNKIYEFKIEEKDQIVRKDIVNDRVRGSLKITKVNDNDRAIAGVVFNVLDADKNVVETLTTGENGVAVSKELTPGTYYYKEVEVPYGYVIDSKEYKFDITNEGKLVAVKVVNYPAKGSLNITKVDNNNKPISGVEFDILDESKNVVDHIVTNKDGVANSKELPLGTYYYKETKAPENVEMDGNEYKFVLTENKQIVKKTVINELKQGKLVITKIDSNNTPLDGVEFDILDENKNIVDHIVTNKDGVAKSKDLGKGTYYYKETKAPDNVVMDGSEHKFILTENNQVIQKTVVNDLKEGRLHIIKKDENGNGLEGVTFEIYDLNMKKIDEMTTNSEGIAESKDLEKGTYYYKETKAPEGIVVDETVHEFTIETDGQIVTVELINYYVRGQLKIYKLIEGTTTPLAGAKFEITNEAGETVETIVSGEDGVALSKKLPYGTYYFKEIEAPDGYIKDNNTYTFKVQTNNEIIETVIYNKEEELPKTGGLVSSNMTIVLMVAFVSICGYSIMRALAAKKED